MARDVNVPNLLTIVRILMIPLFVYLLVYNYTRWALGVFVAAGLTDAMDGAIARMWHQQTTLGRYLDPLADKMLLTAAFIGLAVLARIPFWVLLIVVSRDIILLIGTAVMHLTQGGFDISPTLLGKTTTFLQLVLVVLALVTVAGLGAVPYFEDAVWIVAVVTVVSGLHYLYRGIRRLNGDVV
jgi:cardiolipin synthase (CMP-forming)